MHYVRHLVGFTLSLAAYDTFFSAKFGKVIKQALTFQDVKIEKKDNIRLN